MRAPQGLRDVGTPPSVARLCPLGGTAHRRRGAEGATSGLPWKCKEGRPGLSIMAGSKKVCGQLCVASLGPFSIPNLLSFFS